MNAKQTVPLIATLGPIIAAAAPAVLIGGAIGLGAIWLIKSLTDETEAPKPDTAPSQVDAENQRKAVETAVFRQSQAEMSAKTAAPLRPVLPPAIIPPPAAPLMSKQPPAISPAPEKRPSVIETAAAIATQAAPPTPPAGPLKRKVVTREDMAAVFQCGARALSRSTAVVALKSRGFGQTAAYAALSADGRFAAWLNIAPDGIINWTDGHKA
jgi:hypothetical protein